MSATAIVPSVRKSQIEQQPSRAMRVALYARVSTLNLGQSPDMQLLELREHVERRGWRLSGEYVDAGISGAKERRPELDKLMADAHRRRFDIVAVWKFDRFARSVTHLLRALDTFRVLGIEFVSLSESLDTATPAGRMVFTVLGAVAELEKSLIGERVRAGLRNAKAKGKRLGRPNAIADTSRIGERRASGASWRAIGREMGLSGETVKKLAKSSEKTLTS
jgi:DNA invertase Pin-like site-specific DNA recombinase